MTKIRQLVSAFPCFRHAHNGERGMSLLEILVGLAILAATSVTFLYGMTISSQAVLLSHERVSAESLAKSELEYVKMAPYSVNITSWSYEVPSDPPDWDTGRISLPPGYDHYAVHVEGTSLDIMGDSDPNDDDGIQEITITVLNDGDTVFTLIGYKVNR